MSKRPYKSTRLRKLEGGRAHCLEDPDKLLDKEPKFKPTLPDAPDDLDDEAKRIYGRLKKILEKANLATEGDMDALAILAQIRSRLVSIHNKIKTKHKTLVQATRKKDEEDNEYSEIKPSAYVVMEKQYYQLFRMFAKEFGLTPVGRVGLTVGTEPDDDGLDLLSK